MCCKYLKTIRWVTWNLICDNETHIKYRGTYTVNPMRMYSLNKYHTDLASWDIQNFGKICVCWAEKHGHYSGVLYF